MAKRSFRLTVIAVAMLAAALYAQGVSPGQSPAAAAPLGIFGFIGDAQEFVVPADVDCIRVDAFGAAGGTGADPEGEEARGGLGGRATATIQVTPGETLMVYVGGQGGKPTGGFNGGGDGGDADGDVGGGGGGASDVRRSPYGPDDRVIVAGGGGGGGGDGGGGEGGAGGGLVGGNGAPGLGEDGAQNTPGGGGGTQTAGGLAPTAFDPTATNGTFGQGGQGGFGNSNDDTGGGGGGGYYGGGGGGGEDDDLPTDNGGGGGGGSGFGPAGTIFTSGFNGGNGAVEINPCSDVEFDWTVPERFGFDKDGDGLIDYYPPDGRELVIEPDDWQVNFTHGDVAACDTDLRREWSIDGQLVRSTDAEANAPWPDPDTAAAFDEHSCAFSYKFPDEGVYDVQLEVFDAGSSLGSVSQQVIVQDWLIFSLGDSVASGEGNPDVPLSFLGPADWESEKCHRSALSGPAQAAKQIEDADPKTSVTFVHVACSGAGIETGLLNSYAGVEPSGPPEPPQVRRMYDLAPTREIDAVLISVGANDVEFSGIVFDCYLRPSCHQAIGSGAASIGGSAALRFTIRLGQLDDRFLRLAIELSNPFGTNAADADRHYITEYYDPTRDDDATVCEDILADAPFGPRSVAPFIVSPFGITAAEATWASDVLVDALNREVFEAARTYEWQYVSGIAGRFKIGDGPGPFEGHGYCATDHWIVQYRESLLTQGDQDGTLHPNAAGQDVYRSAIRSALKGDFYTNGDLSMPREPQPPTP